jgi:hypothetical protein
MSGSEIKAREGSSRGMIYAVVQIYRLRRHFFQEDLNYAI